MADIHAQIRQAAREAGVPERLYESLILNGERSWQGWQRSPAGAFGPAQLMPGTASGLAAKYGINPNTFYGNLLGGAYYLKEQLQAFGGNPRKAVAAYNAGPGNVQKYGGVPPFAETQRYVENVFGKLPAGSSALAAPVAPGASSAQARMVLVPGPPNVQVRSAAAPDVSSMLAESLGKIAGGMSPTETLAATTPQLLAAWQQPSTIRITPTSLQTPQEAARAAPAPFAAGPAVPPPGPVRGRVVPTPGKIIGVPYKGTHTMYGNWESDNAVDVATPIGTPVRAVADGVIGSQFGALDSSGDPRLAGLRLHLATDGNEYYYAHLSRFAKGIRPGVRVRKGQVIGFSGEANGTQHLHFASENGNPLRFYS